MADVQKHTYYYIDVSIYRTVIISASADGMPFFFLLSFVPSRNWIDFSLFVSITTIFWRSKLLEWEGGSNDNHYDSQSSCLNLLGDESKHKGYQNYILLLFLSMLSQPIVIWHFGIAFSRQMGRSADFVLLHIWINIQIVYNNILFRIKGFRWARLRHWLTTLKNELLYFCNAFESCNRLMVQIFHIELS